MGRYWKSPDQRGLRRRGPGNAGRRAGRQGGQGADGAGRDRGGAGPQIQRGAPAEDP